MKFKVGDIIVKIAFPKQSYEVVRIEDGLIRVKRLSTGVEFTTMSFLYRHLTKLEKAMK